MIKFQTIMCFMVLSQLALSPLTWGEDTSPSLVEKSTLPAHVSTNSTSSESEFDLQEINQLTWSPIPQGSRPISLADVVKQTEKSDLELLLSREKINETEAKQEDVEAKRMLFFFKYFDSQYLEGSAESDVMAANAHTQNVLNQALLENIQKYYTLARSLLSKYVAFEVIEQGKKQLQLNERRFQAGDDTSFELMQTKTQLVKRYQDFLSSDINNKIASLALAEQLNLRESSLLYPSDITFQEKDFSLPFMQLFPSGFNEQEAAQLALDHRPELKELKFRTISLQNLLNTTSFKFGKTQRKILVSSIKQLDLRRQKTEQGIRTMALKAYEDYRFSFTKIELAKQQLALAAKGLKQAQVSHQSGFSSNKDVLDAQVAYAQAQANYANSLIDANLSQVQLLYEIGLISVDAILSGKASL